MTRLLPITALIALAAACGATDPNGSCLEICQGCCLDGVCQAGDSPDACGAPHTLCVLCGPGTVCTALGQCSGASATGGGGGGVAGGAGGGTAAGGGAGGGTAAGGGAGGGGGGTSCTGESDPELCAAAGRLCGALAAVDRCGVSRSILSCGSCSTGQVCEASGACVCQPESNAQLCQRLGAGCGLLTAADNCGTQRTVSCGTCTGTDSCGGGGVPNACGCTSESDAAFCLANGRSCGAFSGVDNCGRSRTVASCGAACISPNVCSAGQCSCASETNAQLCSRLGASCGALAGTDQCGQMRNVASCGSCYGSQTCGGGGTANQCGCTPASDADLCAARGKNCGSVSATDNCGASRTLSCGTCGGTQTCGGGGTANVCGCTAESNAAFCSRLGKNCGSVTAADNCGASRTVASCGTCSGLNTCGGGGSTDVCGCTGESDATLCAKLGAGTCGTPTVVDACGQNRQPSCGGCTTPATCGGAGAPNHCGTPLTGKWEWLMPRPTGDDLEAVHATSPNDVWMVGRHGALVHWNGTALSSPPRVTEAALDDVNATGASDVWAVGEQGTVLRFDGGSWAQAFDGGTVTYGSVWASGPTDVRVLKSSTGPSDSIPVWNGAQWSASPASAILHSSGSLDLLAGSSATDVWAVGSRVYQFNGLDWVDRTPSSTRFNDLLALAPNDAWAVGWSTNPYYGSSYPVVYHFDGGTWSGGQPNSISSNANLGRIWGASGSDLWITGDYSQRCAQHYTSASQSWTCIDPGFYPVAVHGSSASDVWFVGAGGQVARWNGSSMTRLSTAFPACTAASVVSLSSAFEACGSSLTAVNPQAGTFATFAVPGLAPNEGLTTLWAASSTKVWAGTSQGKVVFFDGATASVFVSYPGSNFQAMWGAAANDVWAGTSSGGLLHYDGASWSAVTAPANGPVVDLWGSSASDVYATGNQGGYLHYDGQSWKLVPVTMSPAFYPSRIHGSSPTNIWATDSWYGGAIYHFDGTHWSRLSVLGYNALTDVWVAGEADVFALYSGSVYHYNGVGFSLVESADTGAFALWGNTPRDLLMFSPAGVLRYQ